MPKYTTVRNTSLNIQNNKDHLLFSTLLLLVLQNLLRAGSEIYQTLAKESRLEIDDGHFLLINA